MSTFIVFLYLQNRYLLDISCTYLLNRAGKRHDTSHLFLQGNYLKSFAVDVILSCFKLSNAFFSKNRSENLASKKQFRTEFISYRHIVHSFESGIPQTEIVKSTICLHPILFSKYTVQIPSFIYR